VIGLDVLPTISTQRRVARSGVSVHLLTLHDKLGSHPHALDRHTGLARRSTSIFLPLFLLMSLPALLYTSYRPIAKVSLLSTFELRVRSCFTKSLAFIFYLVKPFKGLSKF
jgi:hypothetical protein